MFIFARQGETRQHKENLSIIYLIWYIPLISIQQTKWYTCRNEEISILTLILTLTPNPNPNPFPLNR